MGGQLQCFQGFQLLPNPIHFHAAAQQSQPIPIYHLALSVMPNQATSDAKKNNVTHSCCPGALLQYIMGTTTHTKFEPWDVMGLETTGRGSRDGAGCLQSCLQRVLPNAQSVSFCLRPKMDHFLYLLVVPPEKRGYCFSRVDVPSVRPSGSQHGNVHHKLQYIAAHLGPLFRTDLKLS